MRKIKIAILLTLLLSIFVIGINFNKDVNASGLVVMKDHNGKEMTYRNSNEKIYQLAEYNYPTSQLRAVWVSAFVSDVPSYKSESQFKSALNDVLDNMEKMGLNAMVYHLRTHNNAMYKSELNPLAKWYSGVDFDEFDPTAWLIDECHKRGIEFHAWLNPYRISSNGQIPYNSVGEIPEGNPALDSSNLIQVGNNIILDPGIPSNRDFIVDTCMEIVENYDVDAIHFDDYFYISGSVDDETRAKYNTEGLSIGNFRRKQVDLFIEDLSNHLRQYNKENNKTVQLGISPSGIYRNGSYVSTPSYDANGNLTSPVYSNTSGFAHYDDYLYSDTLNWINHEWIDYIMPQCYWATEHEGASYLELTKWWSWAVRNKNVNFYTGMGIYMAPSGTTGSYAYWQYNEDEIQKQLLNAGQYAEFSGACFYKYSSLSSSHKVVKAAVDLISNDYWAKRVPAAVQKYYAPLVDEVAPENVKYNKATNVISYDAVDNVRGYMIYQVPKGDTLDKNNINHVYKYIQDTSITITDSANFDYYVSSVNLANETSEAVLVNINLTAQTVIDEINTLPSVITYDDLAKVTSIRKLYELLDEDQKPNVTNLNKLIQAEAIIASYATYVKKLDDYIASLDLHVKTNRVIPTIENITLSYQNELDSNIYNLNTGERLKNYLSTKYITLIATLNENGIVLSKEFKINVGHVSSSQVGLFYRNDPSCMNPDDEGSYSEGGSGYIGWSGHTVVVDNNILFVSDGNYYEITDPNNISKCNWTSVAGVYVNKTSNNVTMKLGNAFGNKSSDDGYFIINDNKIKSIVTEWDLEADIILKPNESIVILRYLDHLINGSNMSPLSKLYIGQLAYIDEAKQKTPEEQATEFMALIDEVTTNVTLENEFKINSTIEQYNSLKEEVKLLITNYNKLTNAQETINTLKAELKVYQETKINELNTYVDETLYSKENIEVINQYISLAITSINGTLTKDAIDKVVVSTKALIDDVLTLNEELQNAKDKANHELANYVDLSKYSSTNQSVITEYINNAKEAINNAESVDKVNETLKNTKEAINKVKTIEQEEKELQDLRDEYIKKINDFVASYEDISESERAVITEKGESFIAQINRATTAGDITYMWTRARATIVEYFENLENARQNAEDAINKYVDNLDYTKNELDYIKTLAKEQINLIKEEAIIEVINNISSDFISMADLLHEQLVLERETSINLLNAEIQAWYTTSQVEYINELIEEASVKINAVAKKEELATIVNTYKENINSYIAQIEEAINNALSYVNSKQIKDNEEITALITRVKPLIANVKTVDEVTSIITKFDEDYQYILDHPAPKVYTVKFDTNGGNEVYEDIQVIENTTITLPTPTKEGYDFVGWYYNYELIESGIWTLENVTLVAKWEETKYTITFDTNGGIKIDPIVKKANAIVSLPTPIKEGYKFLGWYINDQKQNITFMPAQDLILVAKWENIAEKEALTNAIKEARAIISGTKAKTEKAKTFKAESLELLETASSIDEVNEIIENFNANISSYNNKFNCKNNTYIYLNLLLIVGTVFVLRKKR